MNQAQISIMKKIAKLVFFSFSFFFIIVISAPFSITSKAYAVGISSSQSAFDVLLGLGGFDGIHNSSNGTGISWDEWVANGGSKQAYLDLYGGFFDAANNYYPGLGDYLLSRVKLAATTGTLSFSRAKYLQYLDFIQFYRDGLSVGSNVKVGSVSIDVTSYSSPGSTALSSTGYNSNYGAFLHEYLVNISDVGEYIILKPENDNYYYFVPKNVVTDQYLSLSVSSSTGTTNKASISSRTGSSWGRISYVYIESNAYTTTNEVFFGSDVYVIPSSINHFGSGLIELVNQYRATGTLATSTDLYTTYVSDITDVVTSESTVDDEANISGPINVIINSSDVMSDLLEMLQNNDITLDDYLASVGVGPITVSLTPSEIQELIESIPAISTQALTIADTQSDVIVQSSEKVGTLAHIEHAIANAIASATGQTLPYPDEDPDYVPPGDPHIQDWDFPSLDPDNPDPGGSGDSDSESVNRVSDVANAIPVVAGLASSIFDSASGFNLITTVGYSFVIFSAIIGAYHFFGALGGRNDDVQSHPLDWNRHTERWSSKDTDFKSDW